MERPETGDPFDAVCITLDVDWAAEQLLQHVVARVDQVGVPATFFATHASEVLAGLDPDGFEVGLHPNFEASLGDLERPLAELKDIYPDAVGARSHALFTSSRILALYAQHGLTYESNMFLLGHPRLRPTVRFADLISIPFIWSDDKHLELGLPLDAKSVPLAQPGLKVLNFHPIHLAMNTRDPAHYESYRAKLGDPSALGPLANESGPGIGDLFTAVVEEIRRLDLTVMPMREIRDRFVGGQGSGAELGSRP